MEAQALNPDPSVIHSYKYGWQQMKKYLLPLLLVMLIIIVAEMPASLADYEVGEDLEFKPVTPPQVLGFFYWLLILPVFQYGASYMYLKAARNQTFEVKEVFDGLLCRLAFVPYLVMDLDLGPMEAVERSWKMTRGYGWTIFGMGLLAIPIVILGLVLLLVGVIFAVMWIFCSFSGLYYAVTLTRPNQGTAEITG